MTQKLKLLELCSFETRYLDKVSPSFQVLWEKNLLIFPNQPASNVLQFVR